MTFFLKNKACLLSIAFSLSLYSHVALNAMEKDLPQDKENQTPNNLLPVKAVSDQPNLTNEAQAQRPQNIFHRVQSAFRRWGTRGQGRPVKAPDKMASWSKFDVFQNSMFCPGLPARVQQLKVDEGKERKTTWEELFNPQFPGAWADFLQISEAQSVKILGLILKDIQSQAAHKTTTKKLMSMALAHMPQIRKAELQEYIELLAEAKKAKLV